MRGRLLLALVCAAGLCFSGIAAEGAAPLTLNVTFFANETIAVTLPNGTAVGSTSGAPTAIPAGFYTVQLSGPMGLPAGLPIFHLTGPGVDLMSNLNEGGLDSATDQVTFAPSSSYVWTDDAIPGVVHRFVTTVDVGGAAPATPVSPQSGKPAQDQDIVGSHVVPLRGTLDATVSPTGRLTVLLDGKPAGRVWAGTYRFAVDDRSRKDGLVLTKAGHRPRSLTGAGFVGRRSVGVSLTSGRWKVSSHQGQGATIIVR